MVVVCILIWFQFPSESGLIWKKGRTPKTDHVVNEMHHSPFSGKIKRCIKLIIWLKACLDAWGAKCVISFKNNNKTIFWVELIVTHYWEKAFLLEDNFLFSFLDHQFRCFYDLGETLLSLKNRIQAHGFSSCNSNH